MGGKKIELINHTKTNGKVQLESLYFIYVYNQRNSMSLAKTLSTGRAIAHFETPGKLCPWWYYLR